MWKQKIGISIENNYNIPTVDVVKILQNIGFDAISPVWQENGNLSEIVNTANECGLYIQSLHAPFHNVTEMWSNDKNTYSPIKENLLNSLKDCVRYHIPILVVHTWIGFDYNFDAKTLDFKNFDEIVEYATLNNIKIAFENAFLTGYW